MTGIQLADVHNIVAPANLPAGEAQARARAAWRQSGGTLTGAELGQRFDRGERWGRQQIAAARAEDAATAPAARAADAAVPPAARAGDAAVPPAARAGDAAVAPAAHDLPPAASRAAHNGTDSDAAPLPGAPPDAAAASTGTPAGTTADRPAHPELPPGIPADRPARPALPAGTPAGRPASGRQASTVPLPLIAVTVAAVALVTVVCAVVSYSHIRHLALVAGMGSQAAWLPLGVDGLVVASSCALIVDHHLGRPGQPLAWCGVALGLAGSLAANVLAVDPELVSLRAVRWVLAGYTPAALAVSGHLLFRMLGQRQ